MVMSKFAYFSLLAILYVVVCSTSNATTQPPSNSSTTSHNLVMNLSTTTPLVTSTMSNGSNTSNGSTTSNTVSPMTSAEPTTIKAQPPPLQPRHFHCFIDDKMKSEVELSHIIGVRYADSRIVVSGPGEGFNFHFFATGTVDPLVDSSPMPTDDGNSTMTDDSTTPVPLNTTTIDRSTVVSSSTVSMDNSTAANDDDDDDVSFFNISTIPDDEDSAWKGFPTGPYVFYTQSYNTPLDEVFTENITVAWDQNQQLFHFLVPDHAYRHYKLFYDFYINTTSNDDTTLKFHKAMPEMRSWNILNDYTCHYNVKNNNSVCVSIIDQLVTVSIFGKGVNSSPVESRFSLPNYLSFDKFFSYADSDGTDYILIHHKGQWIYRINYQMYMLDRNMFFKVFHLLTPDNNYFFADFEHADENGLVTKYTDVFGRYRYYYSLFSEVAGLTTYCVYDKFIDGRLMILGKERVEEKPNIAESLIGNLFNTEPLDEYEFPTMLRVLFYCSAVYLSIFLATQMIPNRRPLIFKDLRHADREIQRLAPVIEVVMSRVHTYLEKAKKNGWKKTE